MAKDLKDNGVWAAMHDSAFDFVRRVAWSLPPMRRVAEFGSRAVNGTVREIFQDALRAGGVYVGVDLVPGENVDVVADAADWSPGEVFDAVVCCEVLEHTPRASEVCRSAYRVLRPGGLFILTCAADPRPPHSAVDGGPLHDGEFYRNVGLKDLLDWTGLFGCVLVDSKAPAGDLYALAFRHR